MFRKSIRLAFALALGVGLAACETGSLQPLGDGRISILLTDAPGDVVSAVVTMSEIYLQGDDEEGNGGRVVLMSEPVTQDLLTLVNVVATLVDDMVIPAGIYAQLRFVISGAYLEVENDNGGTTIYATPGYPHVPAEAQVGGTLICPSCGQTGIKVNYPGGIEIAGGEKIVLVDFDVARSFGRQAGLSGNWVMHPVVDGIDFALSGSIVATVELGEDVTLPEIDETQITLGHFLARLEDDESVHQGDVAFEEVDGVWEARFRFLIPGDYVVSVVVPEGVAVTSDPESVALTVASGATASAAFVIVDEEEEEEE
jgi:hypothetical protein